MTTHTPARKESGHEGQKDRAVSFSLQILPRSLTSHEYSTHTPKLRPKPQKIRRSSFSNMLIRQYAFLLYVCNCGIFSHIGGESDIGENQTEG